MNRCFSGSVVLFVVVAAASFGQAVEWQHTTTTLPAARYDLSATSVDGKLIVVGGAPCSLGDPVVDIYDPTSQAWSTQSLQPQRHSLAAVTLGDKAYFAGGTDAVYYNTSYNDVDIYDASTGVWSKDHLSTARSYLAAVAVGDKVVFAGGAGPIIQGIGGNSQVVDILDTSTNQWSTAALASPGGQTIGAAVGTKALFHSNFGSLVDIYDSVTGQWSTANLSHARDELAVTTVGDKVLFAGGRDPQYSSLVDIYDASTNQWSTANLSQARCQLVATTVDHWALFAGGHTNCDVVDIYDANTGLWSVEHLSTGRDSLAATSLGDQAFFIAGWQWPNGQIDTVDIFTVPEPSAFVLLAIGGGAVAFYLRRKRGHH
jgi:N-acetylneuraminic acid mutarotase